MRTTFGIKFYCRGSKANAEGYSPIEMGINVSGRRVFVNLPRKERAKDFDRGYDDLSTYLSAIRVRVNEIITEITLNGVPLTADTIREYMRNGGRKSYTIKRMLDDALADMKTRATPMTFLKYKQVAGMFLSVVDPQRETSTVTPADVNAYCRLLGHYKESSKGAMITKLKTLVKYGMREGHINQDPFRNIRISKPTPVIVYLTEEELDLLRSKKIDNPRLSKIRDLGLFQSASGLSYIEMKELTKDDLKRAENGLFCIHKRRHKTGTEFVAYVLSEGVEIFNKYNGDLGVLTNQKYNSYLKELQDICGIGKTLTSHVFRRTYATRLIRHGVRAEIAAKALGHSDIKMTLRHYAAISADTVTQEIHSKIEPNL